MMTNCWSPTAICVGGSTAGRSCGTPCPGCSGHRWDCATPIVGQTEGRATVRAAPTHAATGTEIVVTEVDLGAAGELLRGWGAEDIGHPGGTLLEHLGRVTALLATQDQLAELFNLDRYAPRR